MRASFDIPIASRGFAACRAEKVLEVLKESEALYEHERENTISQMADAVRSTAKRESNPGLLAPFEKLLRYNSQIADKAAAEAASVPQPPDEVG